MKKHIGFLAGILFSIILIFASCGGGGGGGSTPGPTGPKPVAIYDNVTRTGDAAKVCGKVNPNGSGTYYWELTDNMGGRKTTAPQSVSGNTYQLAEAEFSGLTPNALNTANLVVTNSAGSANDFGLFPSWTTPPAVLSAQAANIGLTGADIIISVNPALDTSMTDVLVRWSLAADMTNYLETPLQPVPGAVDNLVFSLAGLANNTVVYWQYATFHSWGIFLSSSVQSFTTGSAAPDNVTITTQVGRFETRLLFRNNVLIQAAVGNGIDVTVFTWTGPSGEFKAFLHQNWSFAVFDQNRNNSWQLSAGANVSFGYAVTADDAIGRVGVNVAGTGFTGSYEPPADISGNWGMDIVVAPGQSTHPSYPPGNYQAAYQFTQNQNRAYLASTAYLPLTNLIACVNGPLLWWKYGDFDSTKYWIAYYEMNAVVVGNSMSGEERATWSGAGGENYFLNSTFTAIRQ